MKNIITLPFWLIKEIVSDIYWYFKRKSKYYQVDTSNSMADDYIEDRYFIWDEMKIKMNKKIFVSDVVSNEITISGLVNKYNELVNQRNKIKEAINKWHRGENGFSNTANEVLIKTIKKILEDNNE